MNLLSRSNWSSWSNTDLTYNYQLLQTDSMEPAEISIETKDNKRFQWRQYLATAVVNLSALSCGISLGWSSPGLQKLSDVDESPLGRTITQSEQSWVVSLVALGAAVGPFPAGYFVDRIGRKWTLLSSMSVFFIAWFRIVTTDSLLQVYASRFLVGMGIGAVFTALPLYVGEIAEDSIRGSLGSMKQLFITTGLLMAYVIGPYVSFFWLGAICASISIIFVFAFVAYPESPYYLVTCGKHQEAKRALHIFRGIDGDEINEEIEKIQLLVDDSLRKRANLKDVLSTWVGRRALLLSLGLVSGQQLCGHIIVVFYTQDIFEATGSDLPSEYCSMVIGIVVMLSSFITPTIVEHSGRKPLLYFSGLVMALCLALLGGYYWSYNNGYNVQSFSVLPVTVLVFYNIAFCVGFGPLPWAIMAELFNPEMAAASSSTTVWHCWFLGFLLTKYFGGVAQILGMAGTFWIFSGCCLAMTVCVYFFLPETKGKSLLEIQQELKKFSGVEKDPDLS